MGCFDYAGLGAMYAFEVHVCCQHLWYDMQSGQ